MISIPSNVGSKRSRFIVISSPSGGGKTTVIDRLLNNDDFSYSISATTRAPRDGEKHGEAYWFFDRAEFIQRRERGEFLEWEEVYGEFYGTPRSAVETLVNAGKHVIFDLDVKGALKFKSNHPEALLIFLLPPSMDVLMERLKQRSTESPAQLQKRLDEVIYECDQAVKYDYTIVNDDLDIIIQKIEEFIKTNIEEDELS